MTENSPKSKKNSSFFLISVVLLAIIAAVIIFFFNKNKDQEMLPANGNGQIESNLDEEAGVAEQVFKMESDQDGVSDLNFADLMQNKNRNGSYICQLSNEDGVFTYYFNNDEVLVDIEHQDGHFFTLIKKDYTYNWGAEEKTGTKIASFTEDDMEEMETEAEEFVDEMEEYMPVEVEPADTDYDFDPMNFKCRNWQADENKFTPPSDVVFQDLSQMQDELLNMFAQ